MLVSNYICLMLTHTHTQNLKVVSCACIFILDCSSNIDLKLQFVNINLLHNFLEAPSSRYMNAYLGDYTPQHGTHAYSVYKQAITSHCLEQ